MLARPIFRDRKSVRRLAPCLVYFKTVCPSMGSVLGWRISVSPRLSFPVVFTMGCLLWALTLVATAGDFLALVFES